MVDKRPAAVIGRALIAFALALPLCACGYALAGRGNTLPAHIRIIAIPQFVNETDEPELDIRLTDAVRQEFQGRGRFTITADAPGAHGVLRATIKQRTPIPVAFTDGQVTRYQIVVIADVTFRDEAKNEVLWSNPSLRVSEEYDLASSAAGADLAALFRQDRNAIERLSRTFARNVVTSILEAF